MSRPATSSLFAEFYKVFRLGDTDFTVFKAHGMEGYNFAFVRYVKNYHTKNDDFAHADPGSLQHHGDNAWQLLTALADFDLDRRTPGKAIYTDVLGQFVVWWPASINFGLAGASLAAGLAACVIARRRGLFLRFKWPSFWPCRCLFSPGHCSFGTWGFKFEGLDRQSAAGLGGVLVLGRFWS